MGFYVYGMMGRFHLKVTRIKLERKIVGIFGLLFFVILSVWYALKVKGIIINNGVFKKICLAIPTIMYNIFSIKILNGGISMVAFTWSSNIWYAILADISKKMVN